MSDNIFDRVDGVESKVDDISAKMDSLTAKIESIIPDKQTQTGSSQTKNSQVDLTFILSKAKKEYSWLGSESSFKKEKRTALILMAVLVVVLVLSTIFTTIAVRIYSTYTLFENIWLILMVCTTIYILRAKRFYDCYKFSSKSCFRFKADVNGFYHMGKLKKKYKIFFVLTCICAVLNIIVIWMENKSGMAVVATIFELGIIGLSIFVFHFKALYFFYGYIHFRFTWINKTTGQKIVYFYVKERNKFYTEEDYLKQFPLW